MAGELVLIVDDDDLIRLLVETALTSEGYRVRGVASGEAAFAAIARERPDLILLDVMLPGLDGFAVCERLLADPATAEIPVVFLTARAQAEDQLHGLEMGALDYITKPFNPLDLPGIVAVALARSRKAVRGRWQSEREEKLRSLIRLREASAI